LLIASDCKKNPVEPPTSPPSAPDTTSHAFTFQQFSWGNGGGASFLNDAAILSDTNIWTVGTIVLIDSTTPYGYPPYGAVHWDGTSWNLVKLPTSIGLNYTAYCVPTAIIAFSPNDIWLASGGVHRFDGKTITQSYWINNFPGNTGILDPGQFIGKLWGTSDNNLYAVATKGGIAHFDGTNWQKLSSPTQLDITDIYGATDPKTGGQEILAVANQLDSLPSQTQLLRIQGTSVSLVATFHKVYSSVWFVPGEMYYLAGDGIISTNSLSNSVWNNNTTSAYTFVAGCIRGTSLSDIFVSGWGSSVVPDVAHYNGSTWFDYLNQMAGGYGAYASVAFHGNTMIAVGQVAPNAVLLVGKR